ncbi:MAG: TonB-dependent receptor family protein [Thermoanaerobaculia bacterium]
MLYRDSVQKSLVPCLLGLLVGASVLPALAGDDQKTEVFETIGGPAPAETGGAPEQAEDADRDQAEGQTDDLDTTVLFEQLLVVGAPDKAQRIPGAAHVITREELERQDYADIHRVLRQTPGVNIQEEDGYGLRPNIGIRGTGVERSQKVTLLEDGVLIAPAPYSAPSAYYTPTAGRMEGFEIRKGSGAIRQGPYTNGGAINYLSTSIPDGLRGRLTVAAGEEGLVRSRGWVGDSTERYGWLVETFQLETDGFKQLDGGGDTGFDLEDYVGKFRINSRSGARIYQALELKLGKTEQLGHETYLGLAPGDFDRSPYRRYAASAGDNISTDHKQLQLNYYIQPEGRWNLTASLYRNEFFRNWFKLETVGGTSAARVLANPERYAGLVDILRGEVDSAPNVLAVRNNRRDYFSEGLQLVLGLELGAGDSAHSLDFGLRLHQDQEDRFQEDDLFQMLGGRRVLTSSGTPGSNANRIADAEALAVFVQDTFSTGKWTWTPGFRIESIDLMRRDYGKADPDRSGAGLGLRSNQLTEVIPGLGIGYELTGRSNLFLGIHRGFSPPSPSSTQQVEAESSINYELGWRYLAGARSAELVAFFTDYDNLLGNDTLSSGGEGTGNQFNGGKVEVAGIEAGFGLDLGRSSGAGARWPLRFAYTYTIGEFGTSFETGFADWAPRVERGDQLPYLPEHQVHAGLSLEADRWAAHLDASYTGEMRTHAGTGAIPADQGIESRLLVDLKAEVRLGHHVKAWGQILNLTDEAYVAARRPAGLRPGRPRAALFGITLDYDGR